MAIFTSTLNPTPFGVFDSDSAFQGDADAMVTFVKWLISWVLLLDH